MVPSKYKKRNLKRFLMRNLLTFRNRAENRNSRPAVTDDCTIVQWDTETPGCGDTGTLEYQDTGTP